MIKYLLLIALTMVLISVIYYLISNHITFDFKSLFKKGFKKSDNDFGLYCYTGKQGKRKDFHVYTISYKL